MIKLIKGDCLIELPKLEPESVDMVLVDLPYGTTACAWDTIIPFVPMWEQIKRVTKPNAAIVMCASQPFTTKLIASNYQMFKYCWVWDKNVVTGVLNAKKQPLRCVEDVVVFCGGQSIYNPQGIILCKKISSTGDSGNGNSDNYGSVNVGKYIQEFTGYPRQVLNIESESNTIHPTQKPVALMAYLIKTYTDDGDTVLDFTMGSGTTGIAARKLNRKFIGIEKDPEYFKIAQKRIDDARDLFTDIIPEKTEKQEVMF